MMATVSDVSHDHVEWNVSCFSVFITCLCSSSRTFWIQICVWIEGLLTVNVNRTFYDGDDIDRGRNSREKGQS